MNVDASEYRFLRDRVFHCQDTYAFFEMALRVFRYQFQHNTLFRAFSILNRYNPEGVKTLQGIPFLPVEFFRQHPIVTETVSESGRLTFSSSGTGGSVPSRHIIPDVSLYEESFLKTFRIFFGDITEYNIFALLPSYLEREGSSLVYMVSRLIGATQSKMGGFFLDNFGSLQEKLLQSGSSARKTMLIGVSFALLDFADVVSQKMPFLTIVETGGMKGRRRELIREELHARLSEAFSVDKVCSEYGMTELCSQAWSSGNGIFHTPPWMKVFIQDTHDARHFLKAGKTGTISIIDLANLGSCAFIATRDLGKVNENGSFEVLGRLDGSEMRGCNLMVE